MKLQLAVLTRLKLAQKFVLLGGIAAVLVAFPAYQYVLKSQGEINFAQTENRGVAPSRKLIELAKVLAAHRGLSNAYLAGAENVAPQRTAKAEEVRKAITAFDEEVREIADPRIRESWAAVQQGWSRAIADVDGRRVEGRKSFEDHTLVIDKILNLLDGVADHYKLTLDPDFHTYYLIQTAIIDLPYVTESLGQLRGFGAGRLAAAARARSEGKSAQETITAGDRARMTALVSNLESRWNRTQNAFGKVFRAERDIEAVLKTHADQGDKTLREALQLARRELLETAAPTFESAEYFRQMTVPIDSAIKVTDESLEVLQKELDKKVAGLRREQFLLLGAMLATLVLGTLLSLFIVRSVTRPVGHLGHVMNQLKAGDSSVRARLDGTDEIAALARQFDAMVDERETVAAKIRKENEQLNNSVLELLQAVAQLSRKDLTAKVPVGEDVTGALGDALNLLTAETGKVLSEVINISADVTSTSLKVKEQSDTVKQVAKAERREVEHTAQTLAGAAETMGQIADLAKVCNQAADNAIKTTQTALETVLSTVGGINSTRDTIRETEKRIKRLGERSQEISGVVNLINTIAERTHILALNASMHAASAGEAGRGFAVVADEVQRLAENARQATAQIATLVNNIQVETADTVSTMNNAITQVVEGSRLAEQAGSQMEKTQASTSELVLLVQKIAASSQEQAKSSVDLLKRAEGIKKSSEQTSEKLDEQGEYTENLVEYARKLLTAVRVFKLPEAQRS